MNEFKFLGRLADAPTKAEKYIRFPLAVKQDKRGDAEAETDFFTMICFGPTQKVVDKYLVEGKGKLILVLGGVRNNKYEKDGEKKYETSFIVERSYILSHVKGQMVSANNVILEPDVVFRYGYHLQS